MSVASAIMDWFSILTLAHMLYRKGAARITFVSEEKRINRCNCAGAKHDRAQSEKSSSRRKSFKSTTKAMSALNTDINITYGNTVCNYTSVNVCKYKLHLQLIPRT